MVSHVLGHSVSFYQRTQGAPTQNAAAPSRESPEEKVWCVQCDYQQPYRLRAETDTEFPEVEWGNCLVCGSEVLVASREVLRVIGPSAALR